VTPPKWLGAEARKKWKALLPQISNFDPAKDVDALALLCTSWQQYLQALQDIETNGQTLESQNGRRFVNPAVNVMNEAHKQILKLQKQFSIGPETEEKKKPSVKQESKWSGLIDGQ